MKNNIMRKIRIEKIVLNVGGVGEKLERGIKLLNLLTGRQPVKTKSKKRIPTWAIRPGLDIGCKVTLRDKKAIEILKRLLGAVNYEVKSRQIQDNCLSFGIHEYIEIPGIEYQRDIGIMGLDVIVAFSRKGKRIEKRKIQRAKIPKREQVSREEITKFMEENFGVKVK